MTRPEPPRSRFPRILENLSLMELAAGFYMSSSLSSSSLSLTGCYASEKMAKGSSISITDSKLSSSKSSSLRLRCLSLNRSLYSSSVMGTANEAAPRLTWVRQSSSAARYRSSYFFSVCFNSSSWSTFARRLFKSLTSLSESINSISRLLLKPFLSTLFIASLSSSS